MNKNKPERTENEQEQVRTCLDMALRVNLPIYFRSGLVFFQVISQSDIFVRENDVQAEKKAGTGENKRDKRGVPPRFFFFFFAFISLVSLCLSFFCICVHEKDRRKMKERARKKKKKNPPCFSDLKILTYNQGVFIGGF